MKTKEAWAQVIDGLHSLQDWNPDKARLADIWEEQVRRSYERFKKALPDAEGDGFRLKTTVMYAVPDIGQLIERITQPFTLGDKELLFTNLRYRLKTAQEATRIRPSMNKGSPPQLVRTYLGNTPLRRPFYAEVPVLIPFRKRFAHTWFLAGTDTGKTTATMWMIEQDLKLVAASKATIIIIESKGTLTDWLAHHPFFREHPECFVFIEPDEPIAINPFEKRTGTKYEMLAVVSFISYIAAGLMGADFSSNHEILFTNCMELLWKSREPTFDMLMDILYNGPLNHGANLGRTDPEVQRWFANEWPENKERAREVRNRLYSVIRIPTFREMLRHYKSTFNLTEQMDKGRVIIIHARKSKLGSMVNHYGRFFFALLEKASNDRLDENYRGRKLPTFCYVDEAGDFIGQDKKIEDMLDQARSQNIGLILAHQRLGQLSPGVRDALGQAHIKIMRPDEDEGALARVLHFNGKFNDLPAHHFVLHVKDAIRNGVPIQFDPRATSMAQISDGEYKGLRRTNRDNLKPKDAPTSECKTERRGKTDNPPEPPADPDAGVKWNRPKKQ